MSTDYQINKTRAKAGTLFQQASRRLAFSPTERKTLCQTSAHDFV